ncbi:MAG: Vi polysaccharide biosynthesis UDP-N-acetylglucosamine C-6 dehydrogenase TviB, partial [Prochlorococcus marinus subsp. pastoris]
MFYPDFLRCNVAVIGLGYVGLPLAVELSKYQECKLTQKKIKRKVIAYDINPSRIQRLNNYEDINDQINSNELRQLNSIEYVNNKSKLNNAEVFIVTVPTPINESNIPDLSFLKEASKTVGIALKNRSKIHFENKHTIPIVIFESTVFPGATEDICIPIIESESKLILNCDEEFKGFVCGYSPERINPGDKERTLVDITKVTSGSNTKCAEWVDKFYGSIIKAGTYKAKSIKVAE